MEDLVLPYISKFTDLEYYYKKKFEIWKAKDYGVALKLHKYDDVMLYIENRLIRCGDIINSKKEDLIDLNSGNIDPIIRKKMKKDKDFLKKYTNSTERVIARFEKEISELQSVKTAVNTNDHKYIDRVVEETEERSREYIRQMVRE